VLVTFLSGSAALFLVEAMASITGNENFQAAVEYSTLAQLFLGYRWHWVFQIMLYTALQSQIVTSLIEVTFLSTVRFAIHALHISAWTHCLLPSLINPVPQKGWECGMGYIFIFPHRNVITYSSQYHPRRWFGGFLRLHLGYLVKLSFNWAIRKLTTTALVLPLGLIQLSDNVKFQIVSFPNAGFYHHRLDHDILPGRCPESPNSRCRLKSGFSGWICDQ
jgi:hypothetical protein